MTRRALLATAAGALGFPLLSGCNRRNTAKGNGMTNTERTFSAFLETFIPRVRETSKRANVASWNLYTHASDETQKEASDAYEASSLVFADRAAYQELCGFEKSGGINDPLLARQLDILMRAFKGNMLPPDLIAELSAKGAALDRTFSEFRAKIDGKPVSDNDIENILKNEKDPARLLGAWEATKQVGIAMAPLLREMVGLRNRSANLLGYKNYFRMAYELDELDPDTVLGTFASLEQQTRKAYARMKDAIDEQLAARYGVEKSALGPWAWGNPFAQEDPLADHKAVDALFEGVDILKTVTAFYESLGIGVGDIYSRSDLFEREGKNPHAFCYDMDREGDVRILANIRPNFYWFSTMMHETGHGVYDLYGDKNLPWLLRGQAHTLTTEAVAMLAEAYAQNAETLQALCGFPASAQKALEALEAGFTRKRLIFSRWAMVVANFEKTMYERPDADLQNEWWKLVEQYQMIPRPSGREHMADYAAKVHVSTAPAYYQNYLLADILVAQLERHLRAVSGGKGTIVGSKAAGDFLKASIFAPGSRWKWDEFVQRALGKPFGIDAWVAGVNGK